MERERERESRRGELYGPGLRAIARNVRDGWAGEKAGRRITETQVPFTRKGMVSFKRKRWFSSYKYKS
jgi:hypothetical protein